MPRKSLIISVMNIQQAFLFLREKLGSDKNVARYVMMTPQHYEAMRNERVKITPRMENYIVLKALELKNCLNANKPEWEAEK